MRIDSKVEEFALVEDEVVTIDNLIDEAQSLLTWVSPSKYKHSLFLFKYKYGGRIFMTDKHCK